MLRRIAGIQNIAGGPPHQQSGVECLFTLPYLPYVLVSELNGTCLWLPYARGVL